MIYFDVTISSFDKFSGNQLFINREAQDVNTVWLIAEIESKF